MARFVKKLLAADVEVAGFQMLVESEFYKRHGPLGNLRCRSQLNETDFVGMRQRQAAFGFEVGKILGQLVSGVALLGGSFADPIDRPWSGRRGPSCTCS